VNLRFAADRQTLSWATPAVIGSLPSLARYDTLRSANPSDFVTLGLCVETNDGPNTTSADSTTPSSGETFYYLVRARNVCPLGSLGLRSNGTERTGTTCP